jgi:hypothetical protein
VVNGPARSCELLEPGVLEASGKKLDPAFLGEAIELAEQVAFADQTAAGPNLTRSEIQAAITLDWTAVRHTGTRTLATRARGGDVLPSFPRYHQQSTAATWTASRDDA